MLRILIIGGTRFVGRHLVEAAIARGHKVTLFNRGRSNPGLFSEVQELYGDRDGDLSILAEALAGDEWDAVIDTCGYVPRVVRASAELLAEKVPYYVFISTISVYGDFTEEGLTETSALAPMPDDAGEEVTAESYGPLKVLCERVVEEVYPEGALIIRPGLIVGPHDPTERFTYWALRVAAGGTVLAPATGGTPVQFIDARDLAAWIIRLVEAKETGVFNATGLAEPLPLRALLAEIRAVTGSDARFTWVDESFLQEEGVEPWFELPLWMPGEVGHGLGRVNITKALAAGLHFRPLAETIQDTLAWAATRSEAPGQSAGLDPEREEALLERWAKAVEDGRA